MDEPQPLLITDNIENQLKTWAEFARREVCCNDMIVMNGWELDDDTEIELLEDGAFKVKILRPSKVKEL